MAEVEGGYILLSRKLIESEIWNKPPLYLKVWVYILTKAQHKPYKHLDRGEMLISIPELIEVCSYKVGYRTEKPTKSQIYNVLEWLRSSYEGSDESETKDTMIDTTKTTRGMIVRVCNYNVYQDPKKYEHNGEDNNENSAKETIPKRQADTINKNDKNVKNEKNKDIVVPTEDEADSETTDNQKKKESVPYKKIIEYLNNTVGSNLLFKAKGNQAPIKARWNEGYRLKDFESVIDFKFTDPYFKDNPQFFLPKTIFGNKFGNYLQYAEFEKNKKGNKKQKEENRVTPEQLFELERLENEKEAERRYGSKQNQ